MEWLEQTWFAAQEICHSKPGDQIAEQDMHSFRNSYVTEQKMQRTNNGAFYIDGSMACQRLLNTG